MNVFLVTDEVGAHEPNGVFSVWDSRPGAEAEIERLQTADATRRGLFILELEVNKASDDWVN